MDNRELSVVDAKLALTADRLHSAAIHLLRHLRKQDTSTGLTAPRLSALSVIVFRGPLTLKALAEAEQVRPPTMTRIVDALEEAHLVVRQVDSRDQRNVYVSATSSGMAVLEDGRSRRTAQLARQLAALPTDQIALLHQAAEILDRLSRDRQ